MIKVIRCCDACGKELKPPYKRIGESQTKEVNMRNNEFCEACALKIDLAVSKFRYEALADSKTI